MANTYGGKATVNLLTINIQRTFGKKLDPSRTLNSFCVDGCLQLQWNPALRPPNTMTSLLRPLFLAERQNSHTLSCKEKTLVNSVTCYYGQIFFFGPLVTVLTGCHCTFF